MRFSASRAVTCSAVSPLISKHEIPAGRYGEPEDLAALAVFLASPVAAYITGAVLPVDGGLRRYQY